MKKRVYPKDIARNICKNKLYNGKGIAILEENDEYFIVEVNNHRVLGYIKNLNSVDRIE